MFRHIGQVKDSKMSKVDKQYKALDFVRTLIETYSWLILHLKKYFFINSSLILKRTQIFLRWCGIEVQPPHWVSHSADTHHEGFSEC